MSIFAWHFVGDTLYDGRAVPQDGEWLEHTGPLKMRESGLHASLLVFDAFKRAPGSTLCSVECAGKIVHGDDQLVCSRRRIAARRDVTELLRHFARRWALSVIHLWRDPPPDCELKWLATGDEHLRGDAAAVCIGYSAAFAAHNAVFTERGATCAAASARGAYEAAHAAYDATCHVHIAAAAAFLAAHAARAATHAADVVAAADAAARTEFEALILECFKGVEKK